MGGLLLQQEVEMMGKALKTPERPLAALLGGAKVEDKIKVLSNLFLNLWMECFTGVSNFYVPLFMI